MNVEIPEPRRRFRPMPHDAIRLFNREFEVQPHPKTRISPFAAEGRRAVVYQVRDLRTKEPFALKVFKPQYRNPVLQRSAQRLNGLKGLRGLKAAERRILHPSSAAAKRYGDLAYAVLMPWIKGTTWFDLLTKGRQGMYLDCSAAIVLCERFLSVMQGLEKRSVAHTDISAGNVMLDTQSFDVQLLDLEEVYQPGIDPPEAMNLGSKGYCHGSARTGEEIWSPQGDRYATAVLAAEILVLANRGLAQLSTEDGYFLEHAGTPIGRRRYQLAKEWIRKVAPAFAEVFWDSWRAEKLIECPPIEDLYNSIFPLAAKALPHNKSKALIGGTRFEAKMPDSTVAPDTDSVAGRSKGPLKGWEKLEPQIRWHQPSVPSAPQGPAAPIPPTASPAQAKGSGRPLFSIVAATMIILLLISFFVSAASGEWSFFLSFAIGGLFVGLLARLLSK